MKKLIRQLDLKSAMKAKDQSQPLVHCISNYVTANDLANIILAAGGSPIMADEEEEVEEVVEKAQSLLINIGTLNKTKLGAMLRAGARARQLGKPIVFDPVGIGVSKFRQEASQALLEVARPSIIKGNLSEIKYLYGEDLGQKGVDGGEFQMDSLDSYIKMCQELSKKYGCLVLMTGQVDIIAESDRLVLVKNGNPSMEKVTGTGCMLGGLLASMALDRNRLLESTSLALVLFTIAGDRALAYMEEQDLGYASFKLALIDNISKLTYEEIKGEMKIEIY